MKIISIFIFCILIISSCSNKPKVVAKIYERKQKSIDSTLIKFNYELNEEKKQDSLMILATKIISDSFTIKIEKINGKSKIIYSN